MDIYKLKYLKYKNKYNTLKNNYYNLNGSAFLAAPVAMKISKKAIKSARNKVGSTVIRNAKNKALKHNSSKLISPQRSSIPSNTPTLSQFKKLQQPQQLFQQQLQQTQQLLQQPHQLLQTQQQTQQTQQQLQQSQSVYQQPQYQQTQSVYKQPVYQQSLKVQQEPQQIDQLSLISSLVNPITALNKNQSLIIDNFINEFQLKVQDMLFNNKISLQNNTSTLLKEAIINVLHDNDLKNIISNLFKDFIINLFKDNKIHEELKNIILHT